MKKILLCTDGSAYARVSYEYAAWLARRIDCTLEVLYVTDDPGIAAKTNDFSGNIGIDSYQNLLNEFVELESAKAKLDHKKAKIILQEAKQFFSNRHVDNIKLTHETGDLIELFHDLEQDNDLIILGKRGENANRASEHLGANLERIVRSSHKPCLVTPRKFRAIERIMLAHDGGKSCLKALQCLTKQSFVKNLELHVVTVDTGNTQKATQHLDSARDILQQADLNPICRLLQGDAEPEIEQYIAARNIDLIVMGAYGHNRIRQMIIGSTTAQMLRNSQIPVVLFR